MDVGRLSPVDEPLHVDRWDELVQLVADRHRTGARERLFVTRGLSRPARGGGVHDAESGMVLPGVPALALLPEPWWPGPVADWVSRQLSHHLQDRVDRSTVPVLRGRVVGHGWDGEALLTSVDVVAHIGPPALLQARRHHRSLASGRWPVALPDDASEALHLC